MKKNFFILSLALLSLASCTKTIETFTGKGTGHDMTPAAPQFMKYTIIKGAQYCDRSNFDLVRTSLLSFTVKFDSTAIYSTVNPNNQADINKLYGFSDNNALHHDFSARFGWNWSNNALRLYGYIYNNGTMSFKELGTVTVGSENSCSIKVSNNTYVFSLNGKSVTMPRASTTPQGEGYKLYPYFGGEETAPHTISIWIKDI